MPAVWDGKELKQISVADFNARNMPSANTGGGSSSSMLSPVTGAPAQAQKTSGGGIKGGRDPIDPSKVESSQYNTDKNYGYYNDQGKYVSAWQDRIDGGGRNQSGNYFVGGGLFSSLLNALKIRPSGAARERDDQGNYVVDRADIGYRDFNDMRDRGGPQASGGRFEGLGLYSDFANLLFGEQGQRTPYADQAAAAAQAVKDLQNPAKWGVKPTPTPVRTGPSPSYATMDMGEAGRGANTGFTATPEQKTFAQNEAEIARAALNTQEQKLMGLPVQANPLYAQAAAQGAMGVGPFGGYLTPQEESALNQSLTDASNLTYTNNGLRSSFRNVTQPMLTEADQANISLLQNVQQIDRPTLSSLSPDTPASGSGLIPFQNVPSDFTAPDELSGKQKQATLFNSLMATMPADRVNPNMAEAYRSYLLGGDAGVTTDISSKLPFPAFLEKFYMNKPELNQALSGLQSTPVIAQSPRFGPEGFGSVPPTLNADYPRGDYSLSLLPPEAQGIGGIMQPDVISPYEMSLMDYLRGKGAYAIGLSR